MRLFFIFKPTERKYSLFAITTIHLQTIWIARRSCENQNSCRWQFHYLHSQQHPNDSKLLTLCVFHKLHFLHYRSMILHYLNTLYNLEKTLFFIKIGSSDILFTTICNSSISEQFICWLLSCETQKFVVDGFIISPLNSLLLSDPLYTCSVFFCQKIALIFYNIFERIIYFFGSAVTKEFVCT